MYFIYYSFLNNHNGKKTRRQYFQNNYSDFLFIQLYINFSSNLKIDFTIIFEEVSKLR